MTGQASDRTAPVVAAPVRAQRDFERSFAALDDIFAFVRSHLDARGAGEADAYAIDLTIEELFTNMVKYNAAGSGSIGIEIMVDFIAVHLRMHIAIHRKGLS